MATVAELSDPYANFMLNPLPPETDGVCSLCLTFTSPGYRQCRACSQRRQVVHAVLPISYSIHFGQLHSALRSYKSPSPSAQRTTLELAAVLWRFLYIHEGCLAARVGVSGFDIVTTVPSSSAQRGAEHPLRPIVGALVRQTADRHEPLLEPSGKTVEPRTFDPERYSPTRRLGGETMLLIDDTWTTGANLESATAALQEAGAASIGAVVIGRHIHEDYGANADRLRALARFSWDRCAFD